MTDSAPIAGARVGRFDRYDRLMHAFLMFSFLGLAFTGMPLLFSHEVWAGRLARALGGFVAAGVLHRLFAVIMITVFLSHVARVCHRLFVRKELDILWGPASMVPQPRDFFELVNHMRWFVGAGSRPTFDHFTYWEKFDYWAVFWGMGIIGGSGLILWMPEFFAHLLPGWVFNIAMVIHGEEALLAVGFIFTIHFFNSHLRPEKFPMDTVIFTGSVPADEFAHERPAEHQRLVREGRLADHYAPEPASWVPKAGRAVGTTAVVLGLLMVASIVFALVR